MPIWSVSPTLSESGFSFIQEVEEQEIAGVSENLMEAERQESNGLNFDGDAVVVNGGEEHYDEVDSGLGRIRNGSGDGEPVGRGLAVSGSTQTDDSEYDTVDARIPGIGRYPATARGNAFALISNNNGSSCNQNKDAGIFSNLITLVLPRKRKHEPESSDEETERNLRCVSTQTEEPAISVRGRELSCMVIQELALETPVPAEERDDVFEALCCCICEILDKHSILFNGMLRRFDVTEYRAFSCIANELFEATSSTSELRITWGRVVSLFAFAVKIAQKYKETNEEDKLDNVILYLSNYISKHLLDFVEDEGGWEGLVKQFPLPDAEDKQIKRAMMWSGLCVGLMATIAFLSK